MKIRKTIFWLGVIGAGLIVLLIIALLVICNGSSAEFREFARAHADAPARVAALARGEDARTTTSKPVRHAASAQSTALREDFYQKLRDLPGFDYWELNTLGLGLAAVVVPAADFPDEGTAGALRGGKALRERIRAKIPAIIPRRPEPRPSDVAAISSGTFAAQLGQVLDDVDKILNRAGSAYDSETGGVDEIRLELMGSLAALRAGTRGRADDAGRMLECMLPAELKFRTVTFPRQDYMEGIQRTVLDLAERGGLSDAALERMDRMLKQARYTDAQLADLRAAHVMRFEKIFPESPIDEDPTGGGQRWVALLVRGMNKGVRAFYNAHIRPVALAWAGPDRAAYDRAARPFLVRKADMANITGNFFRPDLAAFAPDCASNDDVDLTRLIVAAARCRIATGRWPTSIEELTPRWLEPEFVHGKESFWAVDRLGGAPGAVAGAKPEGQPLFYCARRLELNPDQNNISWLIYTINARALIGSEDAVRVKPGPDGRVALILARAVWLNGEELKTEWIEGLGK